MGADEARPRFFTWSPREALVRLIEHSFAAAPAAAIGLSVRRLDLLADVVEKVPVRQLRFGGGAGSAKRVRDGIIRDLEQSAPRRSA